MTDVLKFLKSSKYIQEIIKKTLTYIRGNTQSHDQRVEACKASWPTSRTKHKIVHIYGQDLIDCANFLSRPKKKSMQFLLEHARCEHYGPRCRSNDGRVLVSNAGHPSGTENSKGIPECQLDVKICPQPWPTATLPANPPHFPMTKGYTAVELEFFI